MHALLFLPTLLALLIVPVGDAIEQGRRDRFSEAHPAIAETHVNLSGDTIWLDMRQASTSMGASPYLEPASAGNRRFPVSAVIRGRPPARRFRMRVRA